MKLCKICNISKPLVEFHKDKTTKDGLQAKCKSCSKQHSQDNKERISKHHQQYRQDNKEYISEYIKEKKMSEGYGVYTLTHLPTKCYYVGEGQIYDRRINHFSKLKRGDNKCGLLQEHYNKHPNKDDWKFEIIRKWDEVNKDEGTKVETKLIEWGFKNVPNKILNKKI